jgi:polysaccharide chain length determinant protein (PEP-CTERM system associated)
VPELEKEQSLDLNEQITRIFGFVTRRRWWILAPFFLVALLTAVGLSVVPNRYTSTATLLVVQQQIPQRYVVPNSETDVAVALRAMKQEVLSRTQLLRIINDFGLYPKQRKRLAPEELVTLMLSNIDLMPTTENGLEASSPTRGFDALKISFTAENATLAQQITTTLTSLFINEYLRTGTEQATNTTNFLRQQLEEKGKLLEAQEERLRDFKLEHVGELPEQQSGNLGILTGIQAQLTNTMTSLERAQQQRAFLQAQLEATSRRRPATDTAVFPSVPGAPKALTPVEIAQNQLAQLENTRTSLLTKGYTSQHPDVVKNQREIARAEEILQRVKAAAPAVENAPASFAPTTSSASQIPDDDLAIAQLQSSLEANRVEIANLTNNENRLKASVAQYESRLNQTPVREQQQAGILRDTEALRQEYAELQKKEQESQLATNLERQQGGRQFRLIDPASLPIVPSSPNRIKISGGGIVGGLVLGFALAFLIELRDTSFYTEQAVTKHFAPPLVLGIPLLPTRREESRRKWHNMLQWAAALTMLMVVAAAEFYVVRMH